MPPAAPQKQITDYSQEAMCETPQEAWKAGSSWGQREMETTNHLPTPPPPALVNNMSGGNLNRTMALDVKGQQNAS